MLVDDQGHYPLLTFAPNPSLDRTIVIPDFEVARIHRVSEVLELAGSKAFNFARAVRVLGLDTHIVGPGGGYTGQALRDLAEREGLHWTPILVSARTRTCFSIVDPANRRVTEVYEQGEAIRIGEWKQVIAEVEARLSQAKHLVVCGSFPSGTPPLTLRDLINHARAVGVEVFLDTYGANLRHALEASPALVKCNQQEVADLVGAVVETIADGVSAALALQRQGARTVIVTLGAQGAVGIDNTGISFAWRAPEIKAVSPVGSGDAFFAALVSALIEGRPLVDATRWAVAVGAANAMKIGAGFFDLEVAAGLLQQVRPSTLPVGPLSPDFPLSSC